MQHSNKTHYYLKRSKLVHLITVPLDTYITMQVNALCTNHNTEWPHLPVTHHTTCIQLCSELPQSQFQLAPPTLSAHASRVHQACPSLRYPLTFSSGSSTCVRVQQSQFPHTLSHHIPSTFLRTLKMAVEDRPDLWDVRLQCLQTFCGSIVTDNHLGANRAGGGSTMEGL